MTDRFDRIPEAAAAPLRAHLAQLGVRQLADYDTLTPQERATANGNCHIHGTPVASRRTVTIDDDHDVHVTFEGACPTCDAEQAQP